MRIKLMTMPKMLYNNCIYFYRTNIPSSPLLFDFPPYFTGLMQYPAKK